MRRVWSLATILSAASLAAQAQSPQSSSPVQIDRVVAVVNDRAILASDLTEEMRAAVLEPNGGSKAETPQDALERLISRALIRQQIREEDVQAAMPTPDEVAARVAAMRKELPICIREQCATDAGWKSFLESHGLTQPRVESYLRNRLVILRFIEVRFRQGVQISQEEIADYYKNTLLPQYPAGQTAPPLEEVSPRIEEILLQQKVSAMFSGWLDNMRKQGDIEVLDPTLEAAAHPPTSGAGAP
jgi:peptidyl-prolyl cis-trans isomerase SurA